MAGAEAAVDSSGPRFAPDDPTLPAPWKGLIDGATLYYWNPETNVTQYDKPAAAAPPLPAAAPPLVPGAFSQATTQLRQVGQQQQQPQQPIQQPTFQYQAQQAQQVPYQQQQEQMPHQQMSQQSPAPQYPKTNTQPMSYQHGPYVQPQQQQQHQGQQYPYKVGQQPQMAQTLYNHGQQLPTSQSSNQGQQPPLPQGSYNQGQQLPMPQGAYNQGPRPPMPQATYNQGHRPPMQQAAYNQGQQPQIPAAAYNQGQQLQGARIPPSQVQHTQQSPDFHQPVQSSQVSQASQSQGLQMSPQQGQLQPGFQFIPQQGKQPNHGHAGTHLSQLSHGQQSSTAKVDDAGCHEGKQTGFSLPLSQQHGQPRLLDQQLHSSHQYPEPHNQLNIHGAGGPGYPAKHHLGGSSPGETNNMRFLSPPAQTHKGIVDTNYRQQLASSHVVPNHITPSPGQPPVGFKMGNIDDQYEKSLLQSSGRLDRTNALQQQPKLAALPTSQNHPDMRNGLPFTQPDSFGGYNMAPSHSMQNPLNHPYPGGALMRPPSGPFTPDFPSIASVDAYRQHHEVTAVGENVPPPFMTFEATGFPPEILREVHAAGFLNPTPIQAQTWPVALQNRDIVAIAKTGSGKTLGYLIPAFVHLSRCKNNPMLGPTVLVLAPTRELASQIQDEAIKFGRSSRVSCTCLYGGAPKGPQLRELERGADIVVATPGRLNDILEMKKINLHQISLLVLDEADRMLDMGFEPQIRKIVDEIPRSRQTLMYTATWPKEVTKIAGDLLRDPVQINIGSIDELVANKSITQYVEMVPPMDKQRRLEQILRAQERGSKIIIFCSTKKMCDQLARGIGRSFGAASIHGDKSQGERDHVLNQFRTGRAPVLVATDVAARGLDIKDIRVVINYDFPTGIEDYVHRIGRTGRAGATGVAYTFFSEQDWKYAGDLVKVLEGTNQHVPPELQQMVLRGATGASRGQTGRMSRWDGSADGSRFESVVGGSGGIREGPGGVGGNRDGPGGFDGVREGPGGFGGVREGPGGFGGRGGPGEFGDRDVPGVFGGREAPGRFGGRGEGPDSFGGRDGPGGFGGRMNSGGFGGREGPGPSGFTGRGGRGSDGFSRRGGSSPGRFGGHGGRGDSPGFGGRGRGDSSGFGGRGRGDSSGFGGRGRGDFSSGRGGRGRGFGGRGRYDRGPHDRFISDGRGRYDNRRGFSDKGRGRSYSRSPDRGRSRGYDRSDSRSLSSRSRSRSRSWSRSRSQSRSWSRSRSRSRSRSKSHDQDAGLERRPRARSGFDVLPPANEAGPALTVPIPGPVPPVAAPISGQSVADSSDMSPGGFPQDGGLMGGNNATVSSAQAEQHFQGSELAVPSSFSAAETFPGPAVQQDAP